MTARAGKRIEIGLGASAALPLAAARKIAAEMREAVATGGDPREALKPALDPTTALAPALTFGAFAESYIARVEDGGKNETHRQQWRNSLRDHAAGIRDQLVADVDTDAVLDVLRPTWMTEPETASRVRGRIEKILTAAKVKGHRPRGAVNPAT